MGEAALHQAVSIPEVVALYIIHSLLISSLDRWGHIAFLITPTEVMLLSAMLSLEVPMSTHWMCAMYTRASPSMDSILLPNNYTVVRSVKWMWAISFTIVALWLFPKLSITYVSRVVSLGIECFSLPADSLIPSTTHHLNKIALTYLRNTLVKRVGHHEYDNI